MGRRALGRAGLASAGAGTGSCVWEERVACETENAKLGLPWLRYGLLRALPRFTQVLHLHHRPPHDPHIRD